MTGGRFIYCHKKANRLVKTGKTILKKIILLFHSKTPKFAENFDEINIENSYNE